MKKFRGGFLGLTMIVAIIILIVSMCFINNFSKFMAQMYPEFSYMRIPMLLLADASVISIISAILFGIKALSLYVRDEIFVKNMKITLENIGLAFCVGAILILLMIIYTNFNIAGSITNLPLSAGVVLLTIISQIFFLLRDLIVKGIDLKEENDLTI